MRRLPRAAGLLALAPTLAMSRVSSLVSTEIGERDHLFEGMLPILTCLIASFPFASVVLDLGQGAPARELVRRIPITRHALESHS